MAPGAGGWGRPARALRARLKHVPTRYGCKAGRRVARPPEDSMPHPTDFAGPPPRLARAWCVPFSHVRRLAATLVVVAALLAPRAAIAHARDAEAPSSVAALPLTVTMVSDTALTLDS